MKDTYRQQYALPVYSHENLDQISDENIQFVINDQLFLDTLLMEIRGKSISYGSYKKRENEKVERDLIKSIDKMERNLNADNLESLETLKESLVNLRKQKMQGHLVRSRATIIENDEKPTNYFCNLESLHYTSKIIHINRKLVYSKI